MQLLLALGLAQVTTLRQAETAIGTAEAQLSAAASAVSSSWSSLSAHCGPEHEVLASYRQKDADLAGEVAAEAALHAAAATAAANALKQAQGEEETYASASAQKATNAQELQQDIDDGVQFLATLDSVLQTLEVHTTESSGSVLGVLKGIQMDIEQQQEKRAATIESKSTGYNTVMQGARETQRRYQVEYVAQRGKAFLAEAKRAAAVALRSQVQTLAKEEQELEDYKRTACGVPEAAQAAWARRSGEFALKAQGATSVLGGEVSFVQLREDPRHAARKQAATALVRDMATREHSDALGRLASSLEGHSVGDDLRMLAALERQERQQQANASTPACETARLAAAVEQQAARDSVLAVKERLSAAEAGQAQGEAAVALFSPAVAARNETLAAIDELNAFKAAWANATDAAYAAKASMAEVQAFVASASFQEDANATTARQSLPRLVELMEEYASEMASDCDSRATSLVDALATFTIKESVIADARSSSLAQAQAALDANATEVESLTAELASAEQAVDAARNATDAAGCHALSVESKVVHLAVEILTPPHGAPARRLRGS